MGHPPRTTVGTERMSLTDFKIRSLKSPAQASDGGGLFIDALPGGSKVWRLRYRLGGKQEKVTLGSYPAFTLAEARAWREDCKALVARGSSPMALKQGSQATGGRERAFIKRWFPEAAPVAVTVEAFAWQWFTQVAAPAIKEPRNIERILRKDIIPAIGAKPLGEVSVADVRAIVEAIKNRGSPMMALRTLKDIKRLFDYAIEREMVQFNPAAAINTRYVATARARDVALPPDEIAALLKAIDRADIKRSNKLALQLLLLTMVRRGELLHARWEEIDIGNALWVIPAERMKMGRPHLVPLSRQALAIFEELRALASGSAWVFPSRSTLAKPVSLTTLNIAVKAINAPGVREFTPHDFRRTASTLLNERGFNRDVIEKALAHEATGVRGIYNKAEYLDQRREMLQAWADFVMPDRPTVNIR